MTSENTILAVAATDGMTPHQWTYAGRRLGRKGMLYAWLDHRGEEVMYPSGPSGGVIGGVYTVKATDDSSSAAPRSAEYTGRSDHAFVGHWRLLDREATTRQEQQRAMKRAQRDNGDFGALTLAELRTTFRRAPFNQQAGMLAAVIAYLEGQARL